MDGFQQGVILKRFGKECDSAPCNARARHSGRQGGYENYWRSIVIRGEPVLQFNGHSILTPAGEIENQTIRTAI